MKEGIHMSTHVKKSEITNKEIIFSILLWILLIKVLTIGVWSSWVLAKKLNTEDILSRETFSVTGQITKIREVTEAGDFEPHKSVYVILDDKEYLLNKMLDERSLKKGETVTLQILKQSNTVNQIEITK
jgi:hypothetical protein